MTDDTIPTAFSEAVIDTFEALYASPQLNDQEVLRKLNLSYQHLQLQANVPAQVLFDNVSKGSHDLIQASDHIMLIAGTHPRELTCETCGRLLSHHDQVGAYASLLAAVQDIEAIIALNTAAAGMGR